jgi:lipopolysaccharide export system ATP-binding protein
MAPKQKYVKSGKKSAPSATEAASLISAAPEPVYEPISPLSHNGEDMLLYSRGLKKVYDGRTVVNGVDIEVRPGEIVGLLGPNGAGKTTTFYMIVGLVRPNGGTVTFDGEDVTHEPMYKRARVGMGYLPQEESIFRRLTVRENILAVMETQNFTAQERKEQSQLLMEKFGISHVADNLAITLSGGEKRRLTIARSLITEPKLLMLDEPFSGVDPIAVGEIQKIILMLRQAGLAILITDHNVRETLSIVDRAYLIYEGQVKRHGTQDFLVNDPVARQLYLGADFKM